jgi:hypothetical protein
MLSFAAEAHLNNKLFKNLSELKIKLISSLQR